MSDSKAATTSISFVDGDRCRECGFVFDLTVPPSPGISAGAKEVATLLTDRGVDVRTRRHATTWSPLEYGCHLRDVLLVERERFLLCRHFDRPKVYGGVVREARGEFDGWSEQDPVDVARQLADATAMYLRVIGRLGPADWDRTVLFVNGESVVAEPSLRWSAVHTHHELVHHTLDVRRQLS